MVPQPDAARLSHLQANAHRPDVQELIRQAIRAGAIRVVPRGAGIAIVPDGQPSWGAHPPVAYRFQSGNG
jgi:hypothetical protein